MKRVKKLIATVIASTFLFSLGVPFASAADANTNASIGRLNALGVVTGYTDGEFRPDQNITRAEYAAIAVRLLGMESAASAAKGSTKFKDVSASHWASGYINLAVGNGIIKGYPSGGFKPEANITYAEAFAMMVRVLGYEGVVTGNWPTNYIGKASQLGILDGISASDFNAAATRAGVFTAADNSLDVLVMKSTKDGYEEDTKTLMEKRLSVVKKAEGVVVTTPNYGEKKKVTIDPTPLDTTNADAYTVEAIDGVDANAFYGEKVVAWVKDDKAIFLDSKNASDVIIDKVVASKTDDTKVFFDAKDKEYNLSDKIVVRQNFGGEVVDAAGKAAVDAIADGTQVKAVLDSSGKVGYVEVFSYDQAMVKDVAAADEKINIKVGSPSVVELKNTTFTITKNGKAIQIADVKAGDVLDVAKNANDTKFYIFATDKAVTGKVESVTSDNKVTIAGTQYKTLNVKVSTNNGDSYSSSLADVQGKNVTARLNKDGKVVFMVADSAATSNFVPMVLKSRDKDGTLDKDVWMKVGKIDGINTNYKVTKDTKINGVKVDNTVATGLQATPAVITNGVDTLIDGSVYKIELAADGQTVKEIKTYAATTESVTFASGNVAISKANDTLGGFKANADSKFAYVNNDGDYKTLTWAGVESLTTTVGGNDVVDLNMTLIVDKGIIKHGFITETTSAPSDWLFGIVKAGGSYDATIDGEWTDVYVNGEVKRFKGDFSANKEQVVQFKLDGNEMEQVTTPSAIAAINGDAATQFVLVDYNETDKMIQIKKAGQADENGIWVSYDKDLLVYEKDVKKSLSFAKGKTIELYDVVNDKDEAKTDSAYDFMLVK